MTSQAVEIPQIQSTEEYALFKTMSGNRAIDYNHVKRLKRSMQVEPHLLASNPIQVNENFYIIDGQHRYAAARELGVTVYYVLTPGSSLADTRVLNVTQKRWSLLDFATSYSQSGKQDYTVFLRFVKAFPKISPSILRTYLSGGQKHDVDITFKNGEFKIDYESGAADNISKLDDIISKAKIHMNTPMATAFLHLFKDDMGFDYDKFMEKLDRQNAVELFHTSDSVKQSLRAIEDVYNFQSKSPKRLY